MVSPLPNAQHSIIVQTLGFLLRPKVGIRDFPAGGVPKGSQRKLSDGPVSNSAASHAVRDSDVDEADHRPDLESLLASVLRGIQC